MQLTWYRFKINHPIQCTRNWDNLNFRGHRNFELSISFSSLIKRRFPHYHLPFNYAQVYAGCNTLNRNFIKFPQNHLSKISPLILLVQEMNEIQLWKFKTRQLLNKSWLFLRSLVLRTFNSIVEITTYFILRRMIQFIYK